MLNKQLVNQNNMIRENEFLREKLHHREVDKMDRAAERIEEKAHDIMRYKDYLHQYPPGHTYPHNSGHWTP